MHLHPNPRLARKHKTKAQRLSQLAEKYLSRCLAVALARQSQALREQQRARRRANWWAV